MRSSGSTTRRMHGSVAFLLITFAASICGFLVSTNVANAQTRILVIAPHPDDDVITSAGVIYRARHTSPVVEVWVMYMTNGDVLGRTSGLARQVEAVNGQALLGVPEDHLVFLGYPDQSLQTLYLMTKTQPPNTSPPFDSPNTDVGTTTFGTRGLGSAPYSRTRTGSDATNLGSNVVADLVHFISNRRPTDIFTVNENERHPDHITTYSFLMDVLPMVVTGSYNPTVHRTAVWDDATVWPTAPDPTQYFPPLPPARQSRGDWGIDLPWGERESLDVPLVMQLTDWLQNVKARAINAHQTQNGFTGVKDGGHISSFVHKDEFFWTARASGTNRPPVPNAGLDQTASPGTQVTLDGSSSLAFDDALGYAWRQSDGPAVTLSNSAVVRPTFMVPNAPQGSILAFELRVSDSLATSVADAVSVRVGAAQPPDAGTDAGTQPDSGAQSDSGVQPDSGTDAGLQDASVVDAGAADSGELLDARSQIDAGAPTDAGGDDATVEDSALADAAVVDASVDEPTPPDVEGSTSSWPGDEDFEQDVGDVVQGDGGSPKAKKDPGCSLLLERRSSDASSVLLFAVGIGVALGYRRRSRLS